MADDIFDEDLFGRERTKKTERKLRLVDKYSDWRFLPYLRIPVEYFVVLLVAVLVLVVVAYAAGVEMGKRIASAQRVISIAEEKKETVPPAEEIEKIVVSAPEGVYTIQLVSYSGEEKASIRAEELRSRGLDADYRKVGDFWQVFLEGFGSFGEAETSKQKIAAEFPDCFIRKIR